MHGKSMKSQSSSDILREILGSRKTSLRSVSERAGIRSPGLLPMILKGERRLTLETAHRLARALALPAAVRTRLFLQIRLENADQIEDRVRLEEKILSLGNLDPLARSIEQKEIALSQYRFFSRWYYPVLYVWVGTESFREDPKELARSLGHSVTATHITEALNTLVSLKLLYRDPTGRLRQTDASISSKDEIGGTALAAYHHQMLGLAQDAVKLPLDERELSGLTIAIPSTELANVKAKIRKFRKDLNESLSVFQDAPQVYQIHVALFPFFKVNERPKSKKGDVS